MIVADRWKSSIQPVAWIFAIAARLPRTTSLCVENLTRRRQWGRVVPLRHFVLVVALVVVSACGRTAVTAGRGGTATGGQRGTPIYDDTRRTIHAGQELDIRLQTPLSSELVAANEAFRAATASDFRNGPRVVVPAGSPVLGIVRDADRVRRPEDVGRLTLAFTELVANGNSVAIDGVVTQVLASGTVGDAENDRTAVPGALSGGIRSGVTENLLMRVTGSQGMIVSTQQGAAAALPAGTIVRVRLTRDVTIQ